MKPFSMLPNKLKLKQKSCSAKTIEWEIPINAKVAEEVTTKQQNGIRNRDKNHKVNDEMKKNVQSCRINHYKDAIQNCKVAW